MKKLEKASNYMTKKNLFCSGSHCTEKFFVHLFRNSMQAPNKTSHLSLIGTGRYKDRARSVQFFLQLMQKKCRADKRQRHPIFDQTDMQSKQTTSNNITCLSILYHQLRTETDKISPTFQRITRMECKKYHSCSTRQFYFSCNHHNYINENALERSCEQKYKFS